MDRLKNIRGYFKGHNDCKHLYAIEIELCKSILNSADQTNKTKVRFSPKI